MPANLHTQNITSHSGLLPIVLGVTGHIDILEEDLAFYRAQLSQLFSQLKNDYPNTPLQIINPLAEGADRVVAQVAAEHNIEIIVPLPLPENEYEKDFPDSVFEYHALKKKTPKENCFELPLAPGNTEDNIREHGDHRDQQYALVGSYIALKCHILIALWDGIKNTKVGGTAQVVQFKLAGTSNPCDSNINLLDPIDTGPVFHVEARRSSNEPSKKPDKSHWLYPDDRLENDYKNILGYIESFNSEKLRKHTANIEKSRNHLIPENNMLAKSESDILDTYAMADVFAIYYQRIAYLTLTSILILFCISDSFLDRNS